MDRGAPICVVGAGQSGILTAAKLHDLGYRDVEILEASPELGGLCRTAEADGEVYDFQAHLIVQQDFGADMADTAIHELITRHPVPTQPEILHFVARSPSGGPQQAVPPHFVPLLSTLTAEQAADQLTTAWTIIERARRERSGPGMAGLAFDRIPGETWESYRARHAPLVGEILQGLVLYANMRRPRQPAETVININAHINGHVSQLAKMLLSLYPADRAALLQRMPPSLVAQIGSRRPVSLGFPGGFRTLLRRIADDHGLAVTLRARVTRIESLGPEAVRVTWRADGREHSRDCARVVMTGRPSQIREVFPDSEIRDLFAERNCPRAWTRSYLVRAGAEPIAFPRRPGSPEPLGFWVIDPYGSYTDTDPDQALHRITAANKQHPGRNWVCFSNSDTSVTDAEAWAVARDTLFLFDEPELLAETIAEWPAYPSAAAVRDGWFDRVEAVQGRDGIYFVGEILSGPTIECISSFVRDTVAVWFA
ncbi:FAD-dependent oxidoreductase [Nocardia sp. alder85J]|uniref:FAD-dependent oxidoreductase n=1 Tax=Nocardia sp. alder85J TaxID=2862949 RepID=UPI001CD3AE3E|nr:FAD-dependent oxidoreductase [Nocardia sp. alder85J]MCX4091970.1 FAD-dependent oxidoreductase [Nocardia sp. alder85J]